MFTPILLTGLVLLGFAASLPLGAAEPVPPGPLTLWFEQPGHAPLEDGLPLGNGRLGALFLGGTAAERIPFNEISLWTGDENPSGSYDTMGSYQAFGDMHLELTGQDGATQYRRSLDLRDALAQVSYRAGGVTYSREYFASHPDQALVVHLTADTPGAYTGTLDLTDQHGGQITKNEPKGPWL